MLRIMNVFEKCLRAEAARDADERVRGHGVTRGRLLSALRKGAAPFREAMTKAIFRTEQVQARTKTAQ